MGNPSNSEVIVSAREREIIDINFMNFLSGINHDFYNFVESASNIITTKEIKTTDFDKLL